LPFFPPSSNTTQENATDYLGQIVVHLESVRSVRIGSVALDERTATLSPNQERKTALSYLP
jgi:hypothetical protein